MAAAEGRASRPATGRRPLGASTRRASPSPAAGVVPVAERAERPHDGAAPPGERQGL